MVSPQGPYFVLYFNESDKRYYFEFRAPNHRTLLRSEKYYTASAARAGLKAVKLYLQVVTPTLIDVVDKTPREKENHGNTS